MEIRRIANQAMLAANRKNDLKIIAVSKTQPPATVYDAVQAGINVFGENYVQELIEKTGYFFDHNLAQPEWHYIGHLQTNKVKNVVPYSYLIHSVDSIKLAEEINKRAEQHNKIQNILLQINTSGEESKSGCQPQKATSLAAQIIPMNNLNLLGLMTIGTFTDNETQQRKEFSLLRNKLNEINSTLKLNLKELSMGMTNDYPIAIAEGSTMVRIGTAYFGNRNYI